MLDPERALPCHTDLHVGPLAEKLAIVTRESRIVIEPT